MIFIFQELEKQALCCVAQMTVNLKSDVHLFGELELTMYKESGEVQHVGCTGKYTLYMYQGVHNNSS